MHTDARHRSLLTVCVDLSTHRAVNEKCNSAWRRTAEMEQRHIKYTSSTHARETQTIRAPWLSDGRPTGDHFSAPSPMAMQVPGRRQHDAPPPLPPPRYVSDVLPGHDERRSRGSGSGRSHPQESRGPSGQRLSFSKRYAYDMEARRLPERPESRRHESSSTTPSSWINRSPTDSERRYEAQRLQDEGYCSMSNPNALTQPLVITFFSLRHG